MQDQDEKLNLLEQRLNELIQKNEGITAEIVTLKREILALRQPNPPTVPEVKAMERPASIPVQKPVTSVPPPPSYQPKPANLERFIGENLAGRIGIIILIIGVAIGIKYAIDHQIIGPAMRLVFGTIGGLVIFG